MKKPKTKSAQIRALEQAVLTAADRLNQTPLRGEIIFRNDGEAWHSAYFGVLIAAEKLRLAKVGK